MATSHCWWRYHPLPRPTSCSPTWWLSPRPSEPTPPADASMERGSCPLGAGSEGGDGVPKIVFTCFLQGLINVLLEHHLTIRDIQWGNSSRYLKVMFKISEMRHLPSPVISARIPWFMVDRSIVWMGFLNRLISGGHHETLALWDFHMLEWDVFLLPTEPGFLTRTWRWIALSMQVVHVHKLWMVKMISQLGDVSVNLKVWMIIIFPHWLESLSLTKDLWLVVWNIFYVSRYLEQSSQLTFIFFRGVGQPPTSWVFMHSFIIYIYIDYRLYISIILLRNVINHILVVWHLNCFCVHVPELCNAQHQRVGEVGTSEASTISTGTFSIATQPITRGYRKPCFFFCEKKVGCFPWNLLPNFLWPSH